MRQIYETRSDLDNEKSICKMIEAACGLRLKKLSIKYNLDFIGFRNGKAVAVIEVKKRHNSYSRYPTLILSLAKYNRGVEFYRVNDLKFIFCVQFEDGYFFYEYQNEDKFDVQIGGRTDRNDAEDIEPVVHIPIVRMKKLCDVK
tara:strand:- start:1 stop:432 length:432 start_codon:yes stop_codon:yes gene_type:complete